MKNLIVSNGPASLAASRSSSPTLVLGLLVLVTAGCVSGLEQRFQAHIDYLASDELEGRGIGSAGIEKAAAYIAGQFAQIGLEPGGDDGTYFQTFEMTLHRTLNDDGRLAFAGEPTELAQGCDFIPFNFSSDEAFSGDVVFCGYGIVNAEKDHDDFAGIDLAGKVALMLRGEPDTWADEDGDATRYATFRNKVYNVKDRDAVAVLIVNQAPSEAQEDELVEFARAGADDFGIPAFHVLRSAVEAQLKKGGLGALDELQGKLDEGHTVSGLLAHVRATGKASFDRRSAPTHNVVGILRGQGALAQEAVVIGAHYDHLGIRKPMMRKFREGKLVKQVGGPQIHNGADDNASGTSGIIEIARLFAAEPTPKRSLVFVAFTGEETGLHGSKHYVQDPAVSLDNTVAMLNLDMVGRLDSKERELTVFGARCGDGFMDMLTRAGKSLGLTITPGSDPGGRSDHAPFIRKRIPSMHFFSGFHSDYHKPGDDSDKINAPGGAKIVQLVHRVAGEIAGREGRPTFLVVEKDKKNEPAPAPAYRVVMGLAPGYGDDGKQGMKVDAVNPEGPADLAGMKADDRIIRINNKKVGNVGDYMAATRNNNPGDTVEVVVLRNGKEVTLQVTLAGAG